MCRPHLRHDERWYVRFYSRDEWPWYQAGVILANGELHLANKHFRQFIESAETHRAEYGLGE